MQHLRPQTRHLKHLLMGDSIKEPRPRDHARVGRKNTRHIGVDKACGGLKSGSDRYRTYIRASSTKRCDIPALIDSLKARDNRNGSIPHHFAQANRVNSLDKGVCMFRRRRDSRLLRQETLRRNP